MRRRLWAVSLWIALGAAPAAAIDTGEPIADPAAAARYEALIGEVRCLVCQNQSIADSNAPLAADLRREIRRMVEEGKGDTEITGFLLERYGDFVLYRPRLTAATAALWLAPAGLLLIGSVVFGLVLRRRRNLPAEVDADGLDDPS
ncbi:MAG: cytochrome c-type biogenesis protein CcmH [Gammaproteobacteria bacterium]|nr:cytochrome c-type biogenesis protein CcmH [Gammaproteobacteria bacterium]